MASSLSNMLDNIINEMDCDTPIYRIFSRQRFLELIKNKKNTLVKPSMWEDPFENAFLKCEAIMEDGQVASLARIREKWYGQCWTKDKDTDAMWRIYSPNKDGVMIKTTVNKIFSPLWRAQPDASRAALSCFIGEVGYKSREDIETFIGDSYVQNFIFHEKQTAKTLLLKRKEFKHENEVRILFQDIHHQGVSNIYQYNLELSSVIEEVIIDPRTNPEEVEMLCKFLKSREIEIPVTQSTLYSFTPKLIKFAPDGKQLPIESISKPT